jgi:glycosyltransferase involved in cell wall biosynthesis
MQRANHRQRTMRLAVPAESDGREDVGPNSRIYFVKARPAPVFDRRYRLMMPTSYLRSDGAIRNILEEERPDLVEICDKYSRVRDRVVLVGAVTASEMLRRYYASADVFVHPNPCEPFGIAPLEAMASGIPVHRRR